MKKTDKTKWRWPLDLSSYDRRDELTGSEYDWLKAFVQRKTRTPWQQQAEICIPNLLTPLQNALSLIPKPHETSVTGFLLTAMFRRQCTFWAWQEADWLTLFEEAAQSEYRVKFGIVSAAYLLNCFHRCHRVYTLRAVWLAEQIFGVQQMETALETVSSTLLKEGYTLFSAKASYLPLVLSYALLVRRSPFLTDLRSDLLEILYREVLYHSHRGAVSRLSYALFILGYIPHPIDTVRRESPPNSTLGDNIAAEWVEACQRWLATSTLTSEARKITYRLLLKAGRWLAHNHPEITTPAQWTREIAADYVAAVERMRTGDWVGRLASLPTDKPLAPRTKDSHLGAMRVFFRDCQAWEWIALRFNPEQAFSTPATIQRLIGPDPRVIADDIWAKLLWAGLNLSAENMPEGRAREGIGRAYPLEMVRAIAVTWLFGGSRVNEICRLRLGCIRWQGANGGPGQDVCLLEIPVNKTGSAFCRPVDPLVGRAIEAWQAVRPPSGLLPDTKTGERVTLLFTYRDVPLGHDYINETLIPLLCTKAGVPLTDTRGRLTSHRARATIASQLYAAREGMSLTDLQQWLGHRTPESTRSYVAVTATQQARAYADADYLGRNIRRVQVLVDQDAIRSGETSKGVPWRYFDLGHGYCTYDLFDTCPHRMACARCTFYLPKQSSQAMLLEGKANLQKMAQSIPLTEEERAAVEDGIDHFQTLVARLAAIPTPDGQVPPEKEPVSLAK